MASRELPRRPSLEHLRNESRDLHRRRQADDPNAKLSEAQLEVARSYGFPSWPKLRAHVETINRYFWPPAEAGSDDGDLVDRFLALACLTYNDGVDARVRPREAAALLEVHPEIATATVHAMAAANEADALRAAIAADPAVVRQRGGPHGWEPLLYAAFARVPGRSTLAAGKVLLDAGADPNAGSLWDGTYPFTALTGVLGGGENARNQPRHPDGIEFARLLLEAGANPNDTQAIYNGMFLPDDEHLKLLFEFELGTGDPGPWAARLGPRAASAADYLQLNLEFAAARGFAERVRLLLEHGVDPRGSSRHPAMHGRTPYELAERAGNREITELLLAAGAEPVDIDPVERFVGACMRADGAEVRRTRTDELVRAAQTHRAPLAEAARLGRADAIRLMLDVGFDINAMGRATPLHEAAFFGHLDVVRELIGRGADPTIRDPEFDATALGWAEYAAQDEVAAYLRSLE